MKGEKSKEFVNINYQTDEEIKQKALKRAKNTKDYDNWLNKKKEILDNMTMNVLINGERYRSIQKAAHALGVSAHAIKRALKDLENTKMSSIEKDLKVTKTITFKKIKSVGLE